MANFFGTLRGIFKPKPAAAAPGYRRKFEAAAVNRLTESWLATQASIDHELKSDLDRLRRRSRDLAKNNEYMAKFLRMVRNNVIGQHMVLQSRPMDGQQLDRLAAAAVELHFGRWCKPSNCDVAGRQGFWSLMRAVATDLPRDGEALIRLRPGRGTYGLQIQVLDVERIDTRYNVDVGAGRNAIIMGIEVDADHRPLAYHLLRKLPGTTGVQAGPLDRERVPADQIVHVFLPLEPEQTRGVPWAHAAMRRLNDLGGYREAAVIAARIGASKMGFFTTPEPDQIPQDGKTSDGVPYTNAEPGQFGVLPPGVGFETFDPAYPHDQFDAFSKATLRGISSGLGVSYNSLASDLEGVNFSSIRSGVLEERDEWMVLQDWFIEQIVDPIFEQWLRYALAAGAITQISRNGESALPLAKRSKFEQHLWMPRRWGWVDPLKDVQAAIMAIDNGLGTVTDYNARNGVDIEDVLATKQREQQLAAEFGVSLRPAAASTPRPSRPSPGDGAEQGDDDDADDPEDDQPAARRRAAQPAVAGNPDVENAMRMTRGYVAEGKTVELALRVEAPAPAPVINVAAPVVNVAPASVTVVNEVQPAAVQVDVAAPQVNLEAQMPAPAINVALEMPARTSTTRIERDSAGRISSSTTTEV